MQKKNTIWIKILQRISFVVILIALWQLVYTLGVRVFEWWKPYAFPEPLGAWESVVDLVMGRNPHTDLFRAIVTSMRRVVIGYAVSICIGAVLGLLLTRFKYLRENARPFILGMQTLPSICWVPFAILWFGLNESAIIFVVIVGSAFGIAIAVENAIQNVEPIYIRAAKTMGAKGPKLYFKVIFPASLPELISGLKQGWSFAWRALMSGEMMSTTAGLGQVLLVGRDFNDINQVMVVMVLIVVIGTLVDKCVFEQLENHVRNKMGLNKDKQR